MVGIIGALDKEVQTLINFIDNKKEEVISGITFYSGKMYDANVVIAVCGIGKVYSAICAEIMIIKYGATQIINTGVAGGVGSGIKVGDIVMANKVAQHDFDLTEFGSPKGYIQGINSIYIECDSNINNKLSDAMLSIPIDYKVGVIVSGDIFVAKSETKKMLVKEFDALACEMEGASIGQVCKMNNVPFGVLRSISDNADEKAEQSFEDFMVKAAYINCEILREYIKRVEE